MTPGNEFVRRIIANLRFQKRALSLVIDWVVAIYLIIPGMLIGGYFYVGLWNNPPAWLAEIPFPLMAIAIGVAAFIGSIRYFVVGGDQLFMIYNRSWLHAFTRYGLIYSFAVKLLICLIIAALLLPALRLQTGWQPVSFACLIWTAITGGFGYRIVSEKWAKRLFGWRRIIAKDGLLLAGIAIYTVVAIAAQSNLLAAGVSALVATLAVAAAVRWRLTWQAAYMYDAEREYRMKMRLVSLFMRNDKAFKTPSLRKRPYLFRKSQRLFREFKPDNGVSEALIKSFYRSSSQLAFYLQITLSAAAGMILAPAVSKWILWVLVLSMLALWMRFYCRQAMTGDYMKMFVIEDGVKIRAAAKAAFWNALPACLLLGVIMGAALFGWTGALLMLVLSPAACKAVTGIICSF